MDSGSKQRVEDEGCIAEFTRSRGASDDISVKLDALKEKLSPILLPEVQPNPPDDKSKAEKELNGSPCRMQWNTHYRELKCHARVLGDLIERIDL